MDLNLKIGVVGYGAVGKILSHALREKGLAWVGAWDLLFDDAVRGARAPELAEKLAPFDFDMTVVGEKIGVASAIKMCRSIFIKGLEAIVIESFTTARRYGVEQQVIASLAETYPEIDWEEQGSYLFSRVAHHGARRAEEMREAATTVREAGFDPWMSAATADKQAWIAALTRSGWFRDLAAHPAWRDYADKIIAAADNRRGIAPKRSGGTS